MRFRTLMLSFAATILPAIALAQTAGAPQTLDQQMQKLEAKHGVKASPATTAPTAWPTTRPVSPAEVKTITTETKTTIAPLKTDSAAGTPAAAVPFEATPQTAATTITTTTQSVAAPALIDSLGNGAIPSLPLDVQASNGINFLNGGIGDEELAQLKTMGNNFSLHVLLSDAKGEYISDVSLRVLDSKGTVLVSVNDAGPYFYAALPAGNYVLQTTTNGESVIKSIKLTVPAKGFVKEHIVYNQ